MFAGAIGGGIVMLLLGVVLIIPSDLLWQIPAEWHGVIARSISVLFSVFGSDLKDLRFEVDLVGGIVGWVTARLAAGTTPRGGRIALAVLLIVDYALFAFASRPGVLSRYVLLLGDDAPGFVQFVTTTRTLLLGLTAGILFQRKAEGGTKQQGGERATSDAGTADLTTSSPTELRPAEPPRASGAIASAGISALVIIACMFLILGVFPNPALSADYVLKVVVETKIPEGLQVIGVASPGATAQEIKIANGKGEWTVPISPAGASPSISFRIPVNVLLPDKKTTVETIAVVTLPLHVVPKDELTQVTIHGIDSKTITPEGLTAAESISPVDEVDRYRRLFIGRQILQSYEKIDYFWDFKVRAVRLGYQGAIQLFKQSTTEPVIYIPSRTLLDSYGKYLPDQKLSVEKERIDSLWLLLQSTIDPGIIRDDVVDPKFRTCSAEMGLKPGWQYQNMKRDGTITRVPQAPGEAPKEYVEQVATCLKRVRDAVCPPARDRLSRVDFMFKTHLLKDEFRSAYRQKVIAPSATPRNLVLDARARYRDFCDDPDAFSELYVGRE